MKRSVVLTVVLALVSLAFITIFAVSEGATPQFLQQQVQDPNLLERIGLPEVPGITGSQIEPNVFADPNKIRAMVKSFEGLDKNLEELDRQSQDEMRGWLQTTTDNRPALERAMEKQVRAELDLIRKIAVEEKAVKTVAAIDGIALNRQERSRKLLKKIEEEAKTLRQPRGTRIRGREISPEGAAVPGQEFGQDANQTRLRPRRR